MALFVRAIAEETRNWRLFKLCLTRALTGYSGAMPRCTGRSLDGSGANSQNSTLYGGVKKIRVASFPLFLHIER